MRFLIILGIVLSVLVPQSFGFFWNSNSNRPTPSIQSVRCNWPSWWTRCECYCTQGRMVRKTSGPTTNGCGASGGPTVNPYGFESCCNDHDVCYGTIGKTQNGCDIEFWRCMNSICRSIGSWGCYSARTSFYYGVGTIGCAAFQSAQRNNNHCLL